MKWTMPRPLLWLVAGLLVVGALGAFTLGIVNAPVRGGRLPGEKPAGQPIVPAEAINATEATPLSQERIEGPPPVAVRPSSKTEEEVPADEAAAALNAIPPATAAGAGGPPVAADKPPPEIVLPPPDDPPH